VTIRRDLIPPTPTPTPATPAWDLVPPSAISGATVISAPSGALTIAPGVADASTAILTYVDSGSSDTGVVELDLDVAPYVSSRGTVTVLVEFGQPNSVALPSFACGVKAGTDASIPVGYGQIGTATGQTQTGAYSMTTATGALSGNSSPLSSSYSVGYAVLITIGSATESPLALSIPMGPSTATRGTWPTWLNPASPSVGDFTGIATAIAGASGSKSPSFRHHAPRVPANSDRSLFFYFGASTVGGSFAALPLTIGIVRPDAGQV